MSKDIPTCIFEHGYNPRSNEIYFFNEVNQKTVANFIKTLHFLDRKHQPITIHLQTEGGDVYEGLAMFDAIASAESHITIKCHGFVASMGSIIVQAADTRSMAHHATLMLHEGSTEIAGTSNQARSETRELSRLGALCDELLARAMGRRGSMRKVGIQHRLDTLQALYREFEEVYLSPKDAKRLGLVDQIG